MWAEDDRNWYVEWRNLHERVAPFVAPWHCSTPFKWEHEARTLMKNLMRKDDEDEKWVQPAVVVLCQGLEPVEQVVLKHDGGPLLMPTISEVLGEVISPEEE